MAIARAEIEARGRGDDDFEWDEAERLFYVIASELVEIGILSQHIVPSSEKEKTRLREYLQLRCFKQMTASHDERLARLPLEAAETIDPSMSFVRENYGPYVSLEEAFVLHGIHELLSKRQGDWTTEVDTDGVRRPLVSFNLKSYPTLELAQFAKETIAILRVIMEDDRKKVREFSVSHPCDLEDEG